MMTSKLSAPRAALPVRIASCLAALLVAAGCAPKAPSPETAPAPAASPASAVMQTCPGPSDGPSIVVDAVEVAHGALMVNPATPLPPGCVLAAFARIPGAMPDSLNDHAIAIAAELDRRKTTDRDLLASEVLLYARAHRYADVSRAFDRLTALDPQPSIDVVRLAIGAARERRDTASLMRILSKSASRSDAPPAMRSELNVLRQAGELRSAIAEARGLVRQNPKYVAAYPSLVGNFGTLGMSDSVVVYIRRSIAQGAARSSLAPALDPFVNTMLRQAALYGGVANWEPAIASAMHVDSALSTPSTKFLVAALIVQSAEAPIGEIGSLVSGMSWLPRVTGAPGSAASASRATACGRIAPLMALLDVASARLREGGGRYAGGGVPQISESLAAEQGRLASLQDLCGRS